MQVDPERCGSMVPDLLEGDAPARDRWVVFGLVAIALLMASIDQTAVATALVTIGRDLDAPFAWTSWTITIYALGMIISLPVAGRLSEQFGRKRVFVTAVGFFTLASSVSGMAPEVSVLIVARAAQGLASGAIMPSAAGIVADHFGRDRDRAIGMFTSIFPLGAIIGPVVGGLLVTFVGWRAIFLINLVPGIVLCVLAARLVVERRGDRRRGQHVDVRGIALLATVLLAGMITITRAGTAGVPPWLDPLAVATALLSFAAGWGLVRHSRRRPDAVIPIRLLRGRDFGSMNTINLLFGAAAVGFAALVPLYAEQRYGLAPLAASGLLGARAVGMIGTSAASVLLLRRAGHRYLMVGGFALLIIGMVLLAMPAPGSPLLWLAMAASVVGLGMGMAAPAANNALLHLAPSEVSALSGLRGMFRQTGAIVAVSVTTSILSASSRPGVTQAWVLVAFAILLLLAVPLIFRVSDHRGRW